MAPASLAVRNAQRRKQVVEGVLTPNLTYQIIVLVDVILISYACLSRDRTESFTEFHIGSV